MGPVARVNIGGKAKKKGHNPSQSRCGMGKAPEKIVARVSGNQTRTSSVSVGAGVWGWGRAIRKCGARNEASNELRPPLAQVTGEGR